MNGEFSDKINMDELYDQRKKTEEIKIQVYNRILNRVHKKIKTISRNRNSDKFCFFLIPEFVLGIPKYDIGICTTYIIDKLIDNGFMINKLNTIKKVQDNYKDVKKYKPTGNLIYNTNMLKTIETSLDKKQ